MNSYKVKLNAELEIKVEADSQYEATKKAKETLGDVIALVTGSEATLCESKTLDELCPGDEFVYDGDSYIVLNITNSIETWCLNRYDNTIVQLPNTLILEEGHREKMPEYFKDVPQGYPFLSNGQGYIKADGGFAVNARSLNIMKFDDDEPVVMLDL